MQTKQSHLFRSFLIGVALSLMILTSSSAQEGKPVSVTDAKVIEAEVLAVDTDKRLLTFRGPKKLPIEVHVSEKIKHLNKIMVGDQLRFEYQTSVAIYLGRPGDQPKENMDLEVERSKEGEALVVDTVKTLDANALIKSIDKTNRTLTLELEGGNVVTTEVGKSLTIFNSLKVGDTVVVRMTKAIAVSVETPER